ncbi:MAG TPA: LTA synthase family protein [Allosphingosinicella sp.]
MEGASARHFAIAFRLALGGLIGCALLQLLLYVRPSPYGGAFLLEWRRYFALALYYDMMGVWLIALPFFLFWLARWRRPAPRRANALHAALAFLMAANLLLSGIDHELLRFLGVRLGLSFLLTYARAGTLSDSLFADMLADDEGGAFLSLVLPILAPALYLWWALRALRRSPHGFRPLPLGLWLAVPLALVPFAAPANAWQMATGKFRLRKVEPVVVAMAVDIAQGFGDLERPEGVDLLALDHRKRWLAESADKGWRFPDPRRPYLRVPTSAAAPESGPRWNLIYIQLETFRGVDMGFLGPKRAVSPTPTLDRLAAGTEAAVWTRALSFGNPSINGLFAVHCSMPPHSRRFITAFTATRFDCLPEILRRHGYRTEMYNAGDTDWDNSSWWLSRWYDRLVRYPEAKESDRPAFRAAAIEIRKLGASGRPFLASVVSVTNHVPFRPREPGFEIASGGGARARILTTTRYTDDVVRELIESLKGEPWFARTLIVIAGDHGFDLGEHGRPGEQNLRRPSTWVPLILIGAHPRLPRGRHEAPASLLDVAPTLADLLAIREPVAWQGHSLLDAAPEWSLAARNRDVLLMETPAWTAVSDPATGRPMLFDRGDDWLQQRDLAGERPALAAELLAEAEGRARLHDYLLRNNLIAGGRAN